MDKNMLTSAFAESEEEKILFSHTLDLALRRDTRNTVETGSFFSGSMKMRCEQMLGKAGFTDFLFWGGYDGAERTCPIFFTDYCDEALIKSEPSLAQIAFIKAELDRFNRDAELSHRDVLGSLMGLGIERDAVGDISLMQGCSVFAVKEAIAPFILEALGKISRYPVTLSRADNSKMTRLDDFEELFDTVASLRLDAITASLFNTSRSIAENAIESGMITVNGVTVKKSDSAVHEGDKISYRSHGRAKLTKIDGISKKGRTRIIYLKWK